MPMYTISQGDCLSSIAHAHGFVDWRTIYNHPRNESFRSLRPDPNVIFPGDELFIPDLTERVEQRSTDQRHPFRRKFSPVLLRIVLLDEEHQPLKGASYKLEVADSVFQGKTGSDGLLEHRIPANAEQGLLSVKLVRNQDETGYTWNLHLGNLDPETVMTGVQARLNNLGYNTGPVDGIQGPRTTEAIKQFQEKYSLKVDGIVGPITRGKLVEVHGC